VAAGARPTPAGFILGVAIWLWFTVLFANFAEALAEGRSKAQAASLRGLKKSTWAKKMKEPRHGATWLPEQAENLRKGDVVLVEAERHGSARWRSDRRRGLGGRKRHHRRIGAGGA
jgi:high-affinity K+ transport system ATPase subunit B